MDKLHARRALAPAIVLLAITGCSGSGSGDKTGRISIGVSDDPMHDAEKVCIAFTGIELKPKDGPPMLVEPTIVDPGMDGISNIDLLNHQGMNAAPLLMDYEVDANEYLWIRFGVNAALGGMGGLDDDNSNMPDSDPAGPCVGDESYLMMQGTVENTAGTIHNLYIPSGAESGLKLHGSIIVPQGGAVDFTAEVDLMKSVSYPGGLAPDAVFRPTLRLVNNLEVGAVTGRVDNTLVEDWPGLMEDLPQPCEPTVYVFEDDDLPADLDVMDSLSSAMVEEQMNGDATEYHYTVGFLRASNGDDFNGIYEAAFSCDDGATLEPSGGVQFEVIADQVTTDINFPEDVVFP